MKTFIYRMMILTAFIGLQLSSAEAAKVEAGKYQIDPMHSKIGFEIPHLVISSVEGKFKTFEGELDIASDFSKSKINASVDINSIDTGVEKRDGHLKSPDFFDAEKNPKMTFVSKTIKGSAESFTLDGDLTIKGQTKPVSFKGKYLGAVTDGYGNRKVAFKATAQINRKDFGLTWNNMVEAGPVVGDKVTIELNIQGGKPAEKK